MEDEWRAQESVTSHLVFFLRGHTHHGHNCLFAIFLGHLLECVVQGIQAVAMLRKHHKVHQAVRSYTLLDDRQGDGHAH